MIKRALITKDQAQKFLEIVQPNEELRDRMTFLAYNLAQQRGQAEGQLIIGGLVRLLTLAKGADGATDTFDGFARAFMHAAILFRTTEGDCLGADLRHALCDVLGLPEIPKFRTNEPINSEYNIAQYEAYLKVTGGSSGEYLHDTHEAPNGPLM